MVGIMQPPSWLLMASRIGLVPRGRGRGINAYLWGIPVTVQDLGQEVAPNGPCKRGVGLRTKQWNAVCLQVLVIRHSSTAGHANLCDAAAVKSGRTSIGGRLRLVHGQLENPL